MLLHGPAPILPLLAAAMLAAGREAVPFQVTIANQAPVAVACAASLAHWHSAELGTAAPAASIAFALTATPADGTVFLANLHGEPMPVQDLWCGVAGKTWETRAVLPLPRRAGVRPGDTHLVCRLEGGRLACG